MWMGKQLSRRAREEEADTGTVTAAGELLCAVTDGEKRNLRVFSPGGYRWQPKAGQRVLVLKNGAVCGALQPDDRPPLECGETELYGPDGACIRFEEGGKIVIEGQIEFAGDMAIEGDLTVSGTIVCGALIVGGKVIG